MNRLDPKFSVLFRACDKVNSCHQAGRPFGLSKLQIIKVSFHSLYQSLQGHPHKIRVIGDNLSAEAIEFFSAYPDIALEDGLYGSAGKSLTYQIEKALLEPVNDWVYICEDDYLHTPNAFEQITHFIKNKESTLKTLVTRKNLFSIFTGDLKDKPLFIHLPDYPDRYHFTRRRPVYLFVDGKQHWRQISNTTHSFMATGETFRKYRRELLETAPTTADGQLSKQIYCALFSKNKALCISPVPGLSTHLTDDVMSPVVDWEKILEPIIAELKNTNRW